MRRTYRALTIVAALAIVAGALTPILTQGLWRVLVFRIFGFETGAVSMLIIGQALSVTFLALVTSAMTFAVVVAAQTRRMGWLAALVMGGALAIYAPIVWYFPIVFSSERANTAAFGYPYSAYYSVLLIEATPLVIAAVLALVFALTGMRQTVAPQVVTEA